MCMSFIYLLCYCLAYFIPYIVIILFAFISLLLGIESAKSFLTLMQKLYLSKTMCISLIFLLTYYVSVYSILNHI